MLIVSAKNFNFFQSLRHLLMTFYKKMLTISVFILNNLMENIQFVLSFSVDALKIYKKIYTVAKKIKQF